MDRFYNAPDTEIDFTEQGGLMWGESAVGKLVAGPEPLRPGVQAFVDEEAGEEVAQKVTRRLQHFIDRKLAAAMEPLLALQKDEALTGLAKGFAFRLVEALGIIPRGDIAQEVKDLDQEARGALRKLGVRFGQFTVFLPPLLKPAPTRLRLVLWGLAKGLPEFPSAPPAGHVTVIASRDVQPGYYAMSGYRAAGDRAIRIDMLERLADLLRDKDSKGGFEAAPEMLSITGLSPDLFAGLMTGLGYKAEKAERPKVKGPKAGPRNEAAPVVEAVAEATPPDAAPLTDAPLPDAAEASAPPAPAGISEAPAEAPAPAEAAAEAPVPAEQAVAEEASAVAPVTPETPAEPAAETPPEAPAGPVEMESYWSFTWGGRPNRGERRDHGGRPRQGERQGDRQADRPRGPRRDAAPAAAPAEGAPVEGAAPAETPRPPRRDRDQNRRRDGEGDKPQPREGRGDRPQGGKRPDREDRRPPRDGQHDRGNKPQTYAAAPPREERSARIDPDNPFAALAALKDRFK